MLDWVLNTSLIILKKIRDVDFNSFFRMQLYVVYVNKCSAHNVIWNIVKLHIDAFLSVGRVAPSILREVQKHTITKERTLRWVSKKCTMTY